MFSFVCNHPRKVHYICYSVCTLNFAIFRVLNKQIAVYIFKSFLGFFDNFYKQIWQNSAYKYSELYAGGYKRKKNLLEIKYSCKDTPRDEKQRIKKLIQDKFSLSCASVVKMH